MRALPEDGKSFFGYPFWNEVNKLAVAVHFVSVKIFGKENLPSPGKEPFILVANHSSRWDGPVVQRLLDRKANYMVSPNEMVGLQGAAVKSVGAFPASPKYDLVGHFMRQLKGQEPIVVFPEGNVFYDDFVHPFKKATARIALLGAQEGLPVSIVPVGIAYSQSRGPGAAIAIGEPIPVGGYLELFEKNKLSAIEGLTFLINDRVRLLNQEMKSVLRQKRKTVLLSGV
ncbi:MAG: 1-acyl-sn-glycerol-3-phosphate acyltransferase [Candidatus Obscuribacterales bacterium]|nr:1-acyl-sn-glycerol-3-phosphate acyltransferase [Candidatus Obscuribacterales bacterium]